MKRLVVCVLLLFCAGCRWFEEWRSSRNEPKWVQAPDGTWHLDRSRQDRLRNYWLQQAAINHAQRK